MDLDDDALQIRDGLTFDDVLLEPRDSSVHPNDVSLSTRLSPGIELAVPFVSSPMDTVTEHRTAICMAQEGGIGFVHKNNTIEQQATEIRLVKRSEAGMVIDPVTLNPAETVGRALQVMSELSISGLPVVENGRLVGLVTNRDLRFVEIKNQPVSNVMRRKLITVERPVTPAEAKRLLHEHRIEKLPVVDGEYQLVGLITIKDIEKAARYPNATKDSLGRLRVGAAVGVSKDCLERTHALVEAGIDILLVDSSHGHAKAVIAKVAELRAAFPELPIMGGNVATTEGALDLIKAGATSIRCGIGPGSICTTRIVAGVGVPQLTAIADVARACRKHGVPVVADGGIRQSGDITKALAAGAESVMIGSLFAGSDESPGELVLHQGRAYKQYRAMGSLGAMQHGSRDRYFQDHVDSTVKLVPEGVEARVPHRGPLSHSIHQLVGGIRSGMGLIGAGTIEQLRKRARFIRISGAGLRESHPHDVVITKEPPNYSVSNLPSS
ncbi:MAG: IMP dehydrogenase [Myxococcales bacterium]|nr:MAG: IMP dehydrogenase [Myxococcales bacterium]